MQYNQFIFDSYVFNADSGELALHYSLDDTVRLTETYRFSFPFAEYDPAVLDRAIQTLFFMAGVSYYKTYVPPEIVVRQGELDADMAAFFSKTYQRGLGEFWYVNRLDPRTPVTFPTTTDAIQAATHNGTGQLVAIGGGKDSLVSIELLSSQGGDITTWSLGHQSQLQPLVDRVGSSHAWVERSWDKKLLELNQQGAYNGHVPISAIFASVGTIVAILSGKRDVVMSNEQSANEPTLQYEGLAINHQYSKSQEFERDYQQYLHRMFGDSLRYYSFLRPLSEVRISEIFAETSFGKYKDVFSSCNRAFVHTSDRMSWCGECPKCAFVFLALTPFIPREELQDIWEGKNLLLDPALVVTYRQLLGIEGDKPLECVGEVKESRAAMRLAFQLYPALAETYQFDIPEDYSYKTLGSHEMPEDIAAKFTAAVDPI
jgi:hypothetical protein